MPLLFAAISVLTVLTIRDLDNPAPGFTRPSYGNLRDLQHLVTRDYPPRHPLRGQGCGAGGVALHGADEGQDNADERPDEGTQKHEYRQQLGVGQQGQGGNHAGGALGTRACFQR